MNNKELFIFDMDGTLVDSGPMIANTINYVRQNIGLNELDQEIILFEVNNPKSNPSDFFYNTPDFTKEQIDLFEYYYNQHCIDDVVLFDEIKPLLEALKKDKKILAVATNASTIFAKKILSYVGIEDLFSLIVGADKVKNPKPNKEMVEYILKTLNIQNKKSILIGDSLKDTMSAKKAGVDGILVNWGFTKHKNNKFRSVKDLRQHLYESIQK
jgi:phosphoglycolate phosphatase